MDSARTLLVVEDDPLFLETLQYLLGRMGHHVIPMSDGEEARRWLHEHRPDAVIVDMVLPGMSGFLLTRTVKEQFDESVPVVMMSGHTSAAHRDYAYASGVDAFLPKPFHFPMLKAALDTHLSTREAWESVGMGH